MRIPKLNSDDPKAQEEYNKIVAVLLKYKNNNITKLIRKFDSIGYDLTYEGKHPQLWIEWKGITYQVSLSSTPSDINAVKNEIKDIKKVFEK